MKLLKCFSIVFVILFVSCKKEDSPQPSTSGGSALPDGSSSSATSFYGTLSCRTLDVIIGGSLISATNKTPYAAFYTAPKTSSFFDTSTVLVDSVICNGLQLQLSGASFYEDPGNTSVTPPLTWHVKGNNGIPDITCSISPQTPGYSGYNTLPDTISKNGAFTIQINGISNANKLIFVLDDGQNQIQWKEISITGSTTATISFTAAEMAALMPGSASANLGVWLTKNNARIFGGKPYTFCSDYVVAKYITIQ